MKLKDTLGCKMHGLGKKSSVQESGKSRYSTPLSKLLSSTKFKKSAKVSNVKKVKPKSKTTIPSSLLKKINADSSRKGIQNSGTKKKLTSRKGLHKARYADNSNKSSSLKLQKEKLTNNGSNEREETDGGSRTIKRRRKKNSKKNKVDVDETGRLQRRTRYLIIKIKLEQNLIDAYVGEGWKGQSREKIRPERELQRAQNQILKCKLGIRDAIHHLHSLGSVGSIEDSVIDADGSVFHEHIFCAKCKSNETVPDNDIVLCDGTCNAAFHQKCLDPPLDTKNIPRGDQGWFCKFCECKMEILEVVNAHLGTNFSMDSTWQDVFKEEAAIPDGGNLLLNPDEDWPSDESDDDDYNPDRKVNSCSVSGEGSEDNASDDDLSTDGSVGSDESTDGDIVSGRRQRSSVDYKKLYNEMFGKDGLVVDQVSDDEDWGPGKRKRREKESDAASTLMALCDSKKDPGSVSREMKRELTTDTQPRRSCFRIPQNSVEKLRQVFAENELPSKAVKDNLSKGLGLDPEKVSKWFKNTRYLALKTRKAEGTKDHYASASEINKESRCGNVTRKADNLMESDLEDIIDETAVHSPRNNKKSFRRKHPKSLTSPLKKNQQQGFSRSSSAKINKDGTELSNDISLRKLLKGKSKENRAKKFAENAAESQVAELEMERLCKVKSRLDNMRRIFLKFQKAKVKKSIKPSLHEQEVIYVPIAALREKM